MNIGQTVLQMPIGVVLETTQPLLDDSMNIESRALQTSPFRDVLRDISSHGNSLIRIMQGGVVAQTLTEGSKDETNVSAVQQIVTKTADMKQLFRMVADGDTADALESTDQEKNQVDTNNQQVIMPQNVVISASGAQLLPLLQVDVRMTDLQIADRKTISPRDVSISVSNAAEPVLSGSEQSVGIMAIQNVPVSEAASVAERMLVAPLVTPVVLGEKNSTHRSETPAQSVLASESHVVRTKPVLNAYYQTSSHPTTVSSNAIQPIVVADGRISQPTLPAAAPSVSTQADNTSVNPRVVNLVPLDSSLTTEVAEAAASSEPVIPVTVAQTDVSAPRATVAPAVVSLVSPVAVMPEVVVVASTAPASKPAAVVPVLAPETYVNQIEPVLNAYYQTSSRPSAVVSPVAQSVAVEDGRKLRPTETAATPTSTNAVTNESAPIGVFDSPISRPAPVTTVPVAAASTETAIPAADKKSFVAVSSLKEIPSVIFMPEASSIVRPVPVMPEVAMVATNETVSVKSAESKPAVVLTATVSATFGENSDIRPALTAVSQTALPEVMSDVRVNLAKPVLDDSHQVPSSPFTVPPPATQSSLAAEISTLQPIGPTASSPPVASSEITPATTLAPLVNLRTQAESEASVAPAVLTAQVAPTVSTAPELQGPAITASVLPQVSSAVRGTVVPLRNPDKVAQETGALHQVPAGENSMSELVASVTPGSVKAPSTLDSGGNTPGNGKEGAERDFSGHGHLFIQPPKAEQAASSVNPISGDLRESLTKESMEHVVQQVKEHLAGRDFKTGTDQVTIRLNPEHMGELKLNLRMENQQLKVEIVAENASVRDALLKHSDSLRETLAKQNISMESFDVTTGGKGSGNQGHNQSAWRELAKQQQQQPFWASARGYNIAQADIPTGQAAYQRQQGHSMLDIHY